MKRLSNFNVVGIIMVALLLLSCNKEGQGGTSSIQGAVLGADHDFAQNEITSVTFTNGSSVEHGDYWLLNSPNLSAYFYIWYDNPTWITNGDPGLQGRVGIAVTFNYSDSNLDIANNTMTEILNTTPVFNLQLSNDILSISNTILGDCPDAEDVTSPFSIDVSQQGKDAVLSSESAMIGEKVYIKYGDSEIQNDIEQTSADGRFQFTGLQKGIYKIYTFTKDTINGGNTTTELELEVTSNGEVYTLDDFHILY
jgi:hypothetical protein